MQTATITLEFGKRTIRGTATYIPAGNIVRTDVTDRDGVMLDVAMDAVRSAVAKGLVNKQLPDPILAAIDNGAAVL
jgi:hypothetical protein